MLLVVGGLGEEVGWRGLAWTRLRRRLGLRDAALVLTVPWAVWHLPLFWIDSGLADLPLLVVPGWLLGLACGAVVLGWLYERSGTSGGKGVVGAAVSAAIVAAMAVLAADRHPGGFSPGSARPPRAAGSRDPHGR